MTKQFKHKKLWWIATEQPKPHHCYTDYVVDNSWCIPKELLEDSNDREEIKQPTHYGNGMCDLPFGESINVRSFAWNNFETGEQAKTFDDMMSIVKEIWKRWSENDERHWCCSVYYNMGRGVRKSVSIDYNNIYNPFFPMFSSQHKAQDCINHFWDRLDVLLSWHNMNESD